MGVVVGSYSGAELNDRLRYRRTVEAALWGSQLVNVDAMRQAYFRDAQASYNDVLFFSAPADWRYQTGERGNRHQSGRRPFLAAPGYGAVKPQYRRPRGVAELGEAQPRAGGR